LICFHIIDLIILARRISICLINIKANIGEISKPPIEGINFLIGAKSLVDISSINLSNGWGLLGATQLNITDPIIQMKKIVKAVFKISIIEIKARVYSSY
jgi:hypothetical protein